MYIMMVPENLRFKINWIIDNFTVTPTETITEYPEINRMYHLRYGFPFDVAVETYGHPRFFNRERHKDLHGVRCSNYRT